MQQLDFMIIALLSFLQVDHVAYNGQTYSIHKLLQSSAYLGGLYLTLQSEDKFLIWLLTLKYSKPGSNIYQLIL